MAVDQNKINSNVVETAFAEESSIKTLPGTPVWYPLDVNTFSDFGGSINKVSRMPFRTDRQNRKGSTVDLDAAGTLNHDLVQAGLQELLQGFFFADLRKKPEVGGSSEITGVTTGPNTYTAASGLDVYKVNDLVFVTGCTNAANNGLKTVTTVSATVLTVSETLIAETPPAATKIVRVGHQFGAGDLVVDTTGSLPQLTTTTKDLTELGLVKGEFIYIGGDAAATKYDTSGQGFARCRSIATNAIVIDKCQADMVADTGAAKTIQVFLGRVLKNEVGSLIKRRTYNIERLLGAPDSSLPAELQSEYLIGAVPNELTFNVPTADKAMVDLAFVAMDHETRTSTVGKKSGTRMTLVEEAAFNTSSNVPLINLAVVSDTNENPTPLFAFAEEMTITINNNVSPDKAIGVLGGFDASFGNFVVSGNLTAYFVDVPAVAAIRNNSDITLDMHLVKENSGITIDIPLMALGDGRLEVTQNEAIRIPLSQEAAIGTGAIAGYDHTMLMCFWDYLPTAAAV
jgi:hypothetical protein